MERDRFNLALLLDYFGGTLTDKQRQYLELYYNDDLSISEIAELKGVSRPGAYDIINRARRKLEELERKTGIVGRQLSLRAQLDRALSLAVETGADMKLTALLTEVANGV